MASARENIATLVGEQKKLRKQKVYGPWVQREWGRGGGGLAKRETREHKPQVWATLPSFYNASTHGDA